MSASLMDSEWNFRILEKRLVTIESKDQSTRKVSVLDIISNTMFTAKVSEAIDLEELHENNDYFVSVNVYTSKDITGVEKDFVSFLEAVDIDQEMEDFIRAYCVYPNKIRFEIADYEEP